MSAIPPWPTAASRRNFGACEPRLRSSLVIGADAMPTLPAQQVTSLPGASAWWRDRLRHVAAAFVTRALEWRDQPDAERSCAAEVAGANWPHPVVHEAP